MDVQVTKTAATAHGYYIRRSETGLRYLAPGTIPYTNRYYYFEYTYGHKLHREGCGVKRLWWCLRPAMTIRPVFVAFFLNWRLITTSVTSEYNDVCMEITIKQTRIGGSEVFR